MIEIQTNLCNECMSTVLMLTLLDPTLAYYTWVKTREPWEYDYSIAFHTKLRHNISYTSITIIMKSISQQTQNDIISLLEQGKSCRQIGQEIGVHYSTVSKFCLKLNFPYKRQRRLPFQAHTHCNPSCHPHHQHWEG